MQDAASAGKGTEGATVSLEENLRISTTGNARTHERQVNSTLDSVAEGFMPGCDRGPSDDFIDNGTWNNRRLLPRACEVLKYNPPMFSWRVPEDIKSSFGWSFVLKTAAGSTVASRQVSNASYRHDSALPAGDYEWQVGYRSKKSGIGMVLSNVRRFRVPNEAEVFLPPGGQAVANAAATKARPRILPDGMSFADIRDMVSIGEYADAYRELLRGAEEALVAPLPAEPALPPPRGTSSWKNWNAETQWIASREDIQLERLGFGWRLSGDIRFRDAGLTRLMNIAGWDPGGATSDVNHDLVNANLSATLAKGLDLFSSELTAGQRALISGSVRVRLGPIMLEFDKLDRQPYKQHTIQQLRATIETLLWMVGEDGFPEGGAWLASVWEYVLRFNDPWGDVDGGFGQGVAYAWWAQNELVGVLVAVRAATGFDYGRHPWIQHLPNFLIAHTTPNARHIPSTGDGIDRDNHYETNAHKTSRLFAILTRSPQLSWYWRQGGDGIDAKGYLSPYHFIAFAMYGGSPIPMAPERHSWLFRDAGMVAIHDRPDAAANRSTVYFRSSRFGAHSHSFADQNAFALISGGKSLLIPGGYRPWYLSNHHALVGRATRYKNALTFDGGIGQAEPVPAPAAPGRPMLSMDARGEIVNFESKGAWTAATGDATLAYRGWNSSDNTWNPLLTSAIRTVAYNRSERVLLVYDYASSAKARAFELNFNALAPFTTTESTAKVEHEGAAACIRVYGANGAFATSSGFAVAPEFARPQQYQARFTAPSANVLATVTVIREDCRSVAVSVQKSGTSFNVSVAGGAPVTLDRAGTLLP
ncbi:MAG: DUF4962 domain-containing protein [Burkholderiales bacterium]|nr:DUF4962 domain-containing protein [Burkholderiales bacterium]